MRSVTEQKDRVNVTVLNGAGALAGDDSGRSLNSDLMSPKWLVRKFQDLREHSIRVVKLQRAHGGCLGVRRL